MTTSGRTDISRTIYLGSVPKEATPAEILTQVKTGAVDSFKILPDRNCAFLTFVDPASAQAFYQEYLSRKLTVQGQDLRVGWGKPSLVATQTQAALNVGATRNVYIGNLSTSSTEESLEEELSKFGQIEHVKILRDKNIAFVHFTSIVSAVKCVNALPSEPAWSSRRINFGKDRCAYVPKNGISATFGFDPYASGGMNTASMMSQAYGMSSNPMSAISVTLRTLYVGGIMPEATCEDLCNSIRGGVLFQIRFIPEKHFAFVTFVDANAALSVYNHANTSGLVVKGRRVRVGWGKPSGIPSTVALAVQTGASRNVYVGGIEDEMTEERLREDFSEFGEIELINTLKEKNCAFVNFTCMMNAMKALAGIKENPVYANYKINYGKDRCGNPPKRQANPNSANGNSSNGHTSITHSAGATGSTTGSLTHQNDSSGYTQDTSTSAVKYEE
ncbi:hypothetical protein PHYBLDRAFT_136143 [Phycomyces blakesleeanus NRRL 1555(-)]|uniref:RRM domain-containing protein n=1 Tax=Phycomyces blakesleeanus (strain ATCC 8743b / DSM 1359 / FGSC 10004 / NBRC 33097 / NRRL 1555) TaxID=763407 RepID=A0A167KWF8_PHYB8|nr:hypothetical protein PHYBLDRAFT_136143 [Phycomyces blakesleeanus NRRL 1555(-)]OAD69046.1 hypothetical protein PHYBLDRAFT_136143 [Phycomyces blakesleeanus NRRL 1555(-)]|eukprot:XP_018287086.1 hypothetical protein PHYBLDRAFT_136143 [Phycomyces blakesleeanus NRRL 1555(-)]